MERLDKLCHQVAQFRFARVFKIRHFSRWMRKTALTDAALCVAVGEMAAGLIDADLGRGVVKKRTGLRMLVVTNRDDRWFFVFGFQKNERENVSDVELEELQDYAADLLALTDRQLDKALADGSLQEVCYGEKAQVSQPPA